MKILGMGMPELLIILGVILLIFGPKNLPKLGAALGSTVKNLREGMQGDDAPAEEVVEESEEDREIRELEEKLAEAKKKKEASEDEGPISE